MRANSRATAADGIIRGADQDEARSQNIAGKRGTSCSRANSPHGFASRSLIAREYRADLPAQFV